MNSQGHRRCVRPCEEQGHPGGHAQQRWGHYPDVYIRQSETFGHVHRETGLAFNRRAGKGIQSCVAAGNACTPGSVGVGCSPSVAMVAISLGFEFPLTSDSCRAGLRLRDAEAPVFLWRQQ